MWSYWTGQKIVCIDATQTPTWVGKGVIYPIQGQTYTIREIFRQSNGDLCFHLVEIVNKPMKTNIGIVEIRFLSNRFRPVKETKSDISLLTAIQDNPKIKIKNPTIKKPA